MNKTKGMSQTLALIVAASVLMMTALTVIFLAQGSLGDFGEDAGERGCTSALEATAATMQPGDSALYPDNCFTSDGSPVDTAQGIPPSDASPGDEFCKTANGGLDDGTSCSSS